jgi:exopolyphosphatase/guanosine-5'-triphosphate,3'-diphosphate pyrophosphatase
VLLLVAEARGDGFLSAVIERATITRLGEGVDCTRQFSHAALARTLGCLDEYARLVREFGVERLAVVGTSAMRDAGGGQALVAGVRERFGVEARIVSGDEEARLAFRGAIGGLPVRANDEEEEVVVFDIGGGSTEVVRGRLEGAVPCITYAASFDLGSVRLTERLVRQHPIAGADRDAIERTARDAFVMIPALPQTQLPVGVAGTMTTLAAVSLGLVPYDGARVHGHTLSRKELRRVVEQLASMDLESRRRVAGMEPKRADVVVAGGFIALALLDRWRADAVLISDRGVRWGLAEELVDSGGSMIGA